MKPNTKNDRKTTEHETASNRLIDNELTEFLTKFLTELNNLCKVCAI